MGIEIKMYRIFSFEVSFYYYEMPVFVFYDETFQLKQTGSFQSTRWHKPSIRFSKKEGN